MDITQLSAHYTTRLLTHDDIPAVFGLCRDNPLYYHHCPPEVSEQSIAADMAALPPNKAIEDKFYIGFFDNGKLIAVLDLILRYPNEQTAFIGFFMLTSERQGKGVGSALISEICDNLSGEFSFIRLGYSKENPQSRHFWIKNGFEPTGVVAHTDDYDIIVMQKAISRQ